MLRRGRSEVRQTPGASETPFVAEAAFALRVGEWYHFHAQARRWLMCTRFQTAYVKQVIQWEPADILSYLDMPRMVKFNAL